MLFDSIKFIDYLETPGEKYYGIATISIDDKVYLRYKISPSPKGGYYLGFPSYRTNRPENNGYLAAIFIDSSSLKEKIDSLIRENVGKHIKNHTVFDQNNLPF